MFYFWVDPKCQLYGISADLPFVFFPKLLLMPFFYCLWCALVKPYHYTSLLLLLLLIMKIYVGQPTRTTCSTPYPNSFKEQVVWFQWLIFLKWLISIFNKTYEKQSFRNEQISLKPNLGKHRNTKNFACLKTHILLYFCSTNKITMDSLIGPQYT